MQIPHLTRPDHSRYYPIVKALLPADKRLKQAESIHCNLEAAGGYKGALKIHIGDGSMFEAEWESADVTRFPARIKAAATALRDSGHRGSFWITHDNGDLVIQA